MEKGNRSITAELPLFVHVAMRARLLCERGCYASAVAMRAGATSAAAVAIFKRSHPVRRLLRLAVRGALSRLRSVSVTLQWTVI
jgi:hypothetical protein